LIDFKVPTVHLIALSMTNGDSLSIGLVWSSDRMTKKRSEAEDTSFCSSGWSVSTSENDRFGIFVDDEFSIKEEAMLGVLKFGTLGPHPPRSPYKGRGLTGHGPA